MVAYREHEEAQKVYLSASKVRRRYGGLSEMTLWRWRKDPDLAFPEPDLQIRGINYWSLGRLEAWDNTRAIVNSQ